MPPQVTPRGILARWLPEDPEVIWQYHHDLLKKLIKDGVLSGTLEQVDETQFSLPILKFKQVIEGDSEIYRDFHEMFDQVLPRQNKDKLAITNYMLFLAALNKLISEAPSYNPVNPLITGVPMYAAISPFANTVAGYHAFTNPKVNAVILEMFNSWSRFLLSPASCNVLTTVNIGWFGPEALKAQNDRLGTDFQKVWVCDDTKPHWGFTSWDDFFVRRFQAGVRDVVNPDDENCINNPCEAITLRVASDVQALDLFWIKEQPYSLEHSLNYDPLATQFIGGTVFQAVLSSMDYHRWHSPVDGRVVKAYVVPGAYYAAIVDKDPDVDVVTRSIYFQTAICTRAFIYIESDNPAIGLVCFVGVGLVEISTCKVEVRAGDRVKKGDEIGSFHFGGSTHLLVFRPQTKLELTDGPDQPDDPSTPRKARLVNSALFFVKNT